MNPRSHNFASTAQVHLLPQNNEFSLQKGAFSSNFKNPQMNLRFGTLLIPETFVFL